MGCNVAGAGVTDELKDYHTPTWWHLHRNKVWITVVIVLWLVALVQPDPAKAHEQRYWTGILTACMNNKGFFWTEPHTGIDRLVFCDNHPIVVRR